MKNKKITLMIRVKDTVDIIGLKEDIAMRLAGVADIERIDVAEDAAEVVHGRWLEDKRSTPNFFDNGATELEVDVLVCSNCGLTLDYVDYHRAYCELCGAKMDGE